MYWYLAGAAVSLAAAKILKKKHLRQKSWYQASLVLAAGFILAAGISWMDGKEQMKMQITRNEPGKGIQEKDFVVDISGEMEDYPLRLEIAERILTDAQRKEYLDEAKKELDSVIAGENPSKDEVTEALYLPDFLQEGAVEASYRFSDYDVFHPDGTLAMEVEKPTLVEITAELSCQEETCLYQFPVCVVPVEKSPQEELAGKIKELVSEQNDQENVDHITLPGEVEGEEIHWKEKKADRSLVVTFLGAAVAVGIFFREKEERKRRKDEREKQMILDYSGIVSKFSLLLGAGMNISLAWEKIALTYQTKREKGEIEERYAYEEMLNTLYEIRDGVGELQAYEDFGNRCELSIYRRLSALIVQNVRKGAQGMQRLLEQEEWEAYEQRKARAKQAGEEAGTKLLLPMGIMLVIVLAILVVPAAISLNL